MRKDVKIGLAIAGVLFAVLIVYVFTPKGDAPHDEVAVNEGEQQPAVEESGETAPPADVPAVDPGAAPIPPIVQTPGDAFAPGESPSTPPADPGSASADAGSAAGSTDWLKTFDTGVVSLETHPPLITQTQTPSPGSTATPIVPALPGEAVTDSSHGPSTPERPTVIDTPGPIADAGSAATPDIETPRVSSPSPAASGGTRTHVVQRNETFVTIAQAVYGNSKYYTKILAANPELDPRRLKVGTVIKLPDVSADSTDSARPAGASVARGSSAPAVNPTTEYRVQPGDSLYKISVKLYGNGGHVDELYETNAATIGNDPGRLKVGMVLKLHDAPRTAGQR